MRFGQCMRGSGSEGGVTSSPSMYGSFMEVAMNWPTVLFPQPAGPVISQM